MSMENIITPGLEATLSSILLSLANFFGTTTEAVMENAPAWLTKYGWYTTLQFLRQDILFGICLALLLGGGFVFIWCGCYEEGQKVKSWVVITGIGIAIITIAIYCFFIILPCLVAPEIVGLEALIGLFN